MNSLKLRSVVMQDRDFLFGIANSNQVRAMSLSTNVIVYEEHCAWFDSAMKNKFFFIGEVGDERVGYIRFDHLDAGQYVLSIALADPWRGKKLGSKLVDLGCANVFKTGASKVTAFVKPENTTSRHLFDRCGFVCIGRADFKGHSVVEYCKVNAL